MANYKVNDVTKFTLTWSDSRFGNVTKNILHFRGVEATLSSAQMQTFITAGFGDYFQRLLDNLCSTTYLSHCLVENLTDLAEPTVEHTYGDNELFGGLIADDDDVPQAAACITRKSFLRGRKAVGHFYFGPLSSFFTEEGLIVPDPALGGDLQDVLDALGDPITDAVTGWSSRPIVCNAKGENVVANNDVRVQSVAVKTVYLKSRRPGVGE